MPVCNLCSQSSPLTCLITENKLKFNNKLLSAAEALTILNPSIIQNILQQTVAKICATCLEQLEKCYAFVQDIILAQKEQVKLAEQQLILPQQAVSPSQQMKAKQRRFYKCERCTEVFISYRHRQAHLLSEHADDNAAFGSTCDFCCTIFATTQCLAEHIKDKHEDQKYVCGICGKLYLVKGHLLQHVSHIHQHKTMPHYCSLCNVTDAVFETHAKALTHFTEKHKDHALEVQKKIESKAGVLNELDLEFEVEFLDEQFLKDFADMEDLENFDFHIPDMLQLNNEPLELYKCPQCHEQAKTQKQLLVHLAHTHQLAVLSCYNCDAKFNKLNELLKHRHQHARRVKSSQFLCEKCQKQFKSHAALQYHLKTHKIAEDPIPCPCCDKLFNANLTLKQHLRTMHTQIKRHICQLCDKQFSTNDHLKKHVLSVHQNDRKYICHICAKAFTQSGHLKQHLQIHAGGKQIACTKCEKKFWRKIDMRRHVQAHHAEIVETCAQENETHDD